MVKDQQYDQLLRFLRSPAWRNPILEFIDQYCIEFEYTEENKLEHTDIHNKFKEMIEQMLEKVLGEMEATEQEFVEIVDKGRKNPQHKKIFDQIIACDNFICKLFILAFKKLMIQRNKELELETVKVMASQNLIEQSEVKRVQLENEEAKLEHAIAVTLQEEVEKLQQSQQQQGGQILNVELEQNQGQQPFGKQQPQNTNSNENITSNQSQQQPQNSSLQQSVKNQQTAKQQKQQISQPTHPQQTLQKKGQLPSIQAQQQEVNFELANQENQANEEEKENQQNSQAKQGQKGLTQTQGKKNQPHQQLDQLTKKQSTKGAQIEPISQQEQEKFIKSLKQSKLKSLKQNNLNQAQLPEAAELKKKVEETFQKNREQNIQIQESLKDKLGSENLKKRQDRLRSQRDILLKKMTQKRENELQQYMQQVQGQQQENENQQFITLTEEESKRLQTYQNIAEQIKSNINTNEQSLQQQLEMAKALRDQKQEFLQ